jgi:hypothetical protein
MKIFLIMLFTEEFCSKGRFAYVTGIEVTVLSEDIHSITNFVTDLHITRANDFLVLQQQNLKRDLAKAEKLYKEYSSVATKFERAQVGSPKPCSITNIYRID